MTQQSKPKPLTPAQCRLLSRLSRGGPQTSRELADGARSKSATTGVLRALEARGLVASEKLERGWYGERRYSLTDEAHRIGYRYRVPVQENPEVVKADKRWGEALSRGTVEEERAAQKVVWEAVAELRKVLERYAK